MAIQVFETIMSNFIVKKKALLEDIVRFYTVNAFREKIFFLYTQMCKCISGRKNDQEKMMPLGFELFLPRRQMILSQ